jgi:hypothetical protein
MIMAFWNINTGIGSFDERIGTFLRWCNARQPQLLFLEEVSHKLGPYLPFLTDMRSLGFVNTLDKNDNPTTKQIHALARPNIAGDFVCRTVRFPGLTAKRALLKVSARQGALHPCSIWVVHANASKKGGTEATTAANAYLAANDDAIVGGDFNLSSGLAGLKATRAISWQHNRLRFTQWRKTAGTTGSPNDKLHLEKSGTAIYAKIESHKVIDYVMTGSNRVVANVDNCTTEANWRDILTYFDHCPVVFNIT